GRVQRVPRGDGGARRRDQGRPAQGPRPPPARPHRRPGGEGVLGAVPAPPEFVVMFVPAEAFLNAALEEDPTLLEHAFERNVVVATPSTLIALLRTVSYTWRQEALAENAQRVFVVGRELHGRLATLGGHVAKLGAQLN